MLLCIFPLSAMESLILIWLTANSLLLLGSLVGVFVLVRDRKQLRRKQQKLEQTIAELSSQQAQTKRFLDDWLTMFENVETGTVNASKAAKGLAKVIYRFGGIEAANRKTTSNGRSSRYR